MKSKQKKAKKKGGASSRKSPEQKKRAAKKKPSSRKSAPKVPPVPAATPVPNGKFYSRSELKDFRVLLLRRKTILVGDVKGLEGEAMKKGSDASGDLSTLPMHLADLGTDSFEQDISLGRMESESDEIKEIEEAIDRIQDGSFGECEGCEKRIPKERLKAIPYARLCVACKMKEENL